METLETEVIFLKRLEKIPITKGSFLFYDSIFEKKYPKFLKTFPNKIALKSGEKLKSLESIRDVLPLALKATGGLPCAEITFLSFGGGSVGDFVGFLASIYKRGVGLVHIPSTALAAMDSSHGGKTALNFLDIKNQLGTFYPAKHVFIVAEVIDQLPSSNIQEAWGEVLKMGLISGGSLWKKIDQNFWLVLPDLVSAKMRIVAKDPFEKKGLRRVLNLGHSVGHVLESRLSLPHGKAVFFGVLFALDWSLKKKYLSQIEYEKIKILILAAPQMSQAFHQKRTFLNLVSNPHFELLQDKKLVSPHKIEETFILKPGKVVREKISIQMFKNEWKRQACV